MTVSLDNLVEMPLVRMKLESVKNDPVRNTYFSNRTFVMIGKVPQRPSYVVLVDITDGTVVPMMLASDFEYID